VIECLLAIDEPTAHCRPLSADRRWLPAFATFLCVAVLDYGVARFTLWLSTGALGHVTPLWPATGLSLGLLLLRGWPVLPAVLLSNTLLMLPRADPWAAVAIGVVSVAELVVARAALVHLQFDPALMRVSDGLRLIAASVVAGMVSATVGVTVLVWAGETGSEPYWWGWSLWAMRRILGISVCTPLILSWWQRLTGGRSFSWRRAGEAAAIAVAVSLGTLSAFTSSTPLATGDGYLFGVFPFVIWTALRFRVRGVSTLVLILSGLMVAVTGDASPTSLPLLSAQLMALESFVGILAFTGLLLALSNEERAQALTRLDERAVQQAAVAGIARRSLGDPNPARIASLALDTIVPTLGVTFGVILCRDTANSAIRVLALTGLPAGAEGDATWPHADSPFALAALEAATPTTWSSQDLAVPGQPPGIRLSGAGLVVPIIGQAPWRGAICVFAEQPDRFHQADGAFLQAVADLLAAAIDRDTASRGRQDLEQQLRQAQKMEAVGRLAGGIAHDFNNLLTVITSYTQILLARLKRGEPLQREVAQIDRAAHRAAELTQQLLAFGRKQLLRPRVVDLGEVCMQFAPLLRRLVPEHVRLTLTCEPRRLQVRVDPSQVEQVVMNLAVNACDAMPRGGDLRLDVSHVEGDSGPAMVRLRVEDTGQGIPPEVTTQIFEPFFTTKQPGGGTGLGLSTVYGIVKQTGGYIYPLSEVGVGTTFQIFLPRHIPTADTSPKKTLEPPAVTDLTGNATILLVEDEVAVRAFAARALQSRGYTVHEAGSGTEALEVMAETGGTIDLVVSDVVMPEMDGPSLLRELRKTRPDLKIIFVSGYAEDAFKKNLPENEQFSFLPKPFSLKDLATTVKETLASP
jgi:signal transduction histidine kinase/integral membrane sensor domain MASE1